MGADVGSVWTEIGVVGVAPQVETKDPKQCRHVLPSTACNHERTPSAPL